MQVPLCSPNGYVELDYGVTVLLWVAAIMQAAVVRDRSIYKSRFAESCRWLIVAGTTGVAARFTALLVDYGDLTLSGYTLAAIAAVAIGMTGLAMERLMMPPRKRRSTDWAELDDMEGAQ